MNTDRRQPTNLQPDPELLARLLRLVAPTPTRRLRSQAVRAELRALVEPRWQEDASCATADPEAWFPVKESRPAGQVTRICAACPVSRSCLAVAMLWNEDGIWAGTSPNHRKLGYRLLRLGSSGAEVIELLLTWAKQPRATRPRWSGAAAPSIGMPGSQALSRPGDDGQEAAA